MRCKETDKSTNKSNVYEPDDDQVSKVFWTEAQNPNSIDDDNSVSFDLIGLFLYVLDHYKLILLCGLLAAAAMVGFVTLRSNGSAYRAASKLYVINPAAESISTNMLNTGDQLKYDYVEMLTVWEVYERVLQKLGVDWGYSDLAQMTSIKASDNSRIITITITNGNPKLAVDIANAYVDVARTFISEIMRIDKPPVVSHALQASIVPEKMSKRSGAIRGFVVGSILPMMILVLFYYVNDKVRTAEDVKRSVNVPVFAALPKNGVQKTNKKQPYDDEKNNNANTEGEKTCVFTKLPEYSQAFQIGLNSIAANITFLGNSVKTIMITSSGEGNGKSSVALGLVRTLSSLGYSVALIDADLKDSRLCERYGIDFEDEKVSGLRHYLEGECSAEDILYRTNFGEAAFFPVGANIDDPFCLLSNQAFTDLLKDLSYKFNYIIVDAPLVSLGIDAAVVARFCDGALYVVKCNADSRKDVRESCAQIVNAGTPVIGAVLIDAVSK